MACRRSSCSDPIPAPSASLSIKSCHTGRPAPADTPAPRKSTTLPVLARYASSPAASTSGCPRSAQGERLSASRTAMDRRRARWAAEYMARAPVRELSHVTRATSTSCSRAAWSSAETCASRSAPLFRRPPPYPVPSTGSASSGTGRPPRLRCPSREPQRRRRTDCHTPCTSRARHRRYPPTRRRRTRSAVRAPSSALCRPWGGREASATASTTPRPRRARATSSSRSRRPRRSGAATRRSAAS